MAVDDRQARLTRLIDAKGVSGFEHEAQDVVASQLAASGGERRDALGNLWASHAADQPSPRLLLEAHVDEIGLMVSEVLPGGFLAFTGSRSWLPGSLVSQRVEVGTDGRAVPGIIGSRSGFYAPDAGARAGAASDDLYIDVGACDERQVAQMGIRPGLPVVPVTRSFLSADGMTIFGKALDNRVGVSVMLEAFREAVVRGRHPNTLIIASTTQEENGGRGVAALEVSLRADIAIVLEAIAARDTPPRERGLDPQPAQGRGPILVSFDDGMISHPAFLDWCLALARSEEIPVQVVRAYGVNNAARLQTFWGGVPTLVIGVPCRHIHTTLGSMRLADYEQTIALVLSIVERLDVRALEGMSRAVP